MIPRAKKNLHECEYHLNNLLSSKHFEEVEINFAAFINSARNSTFVLQKEFKKYSSFIEWYGDPDNSENAEKGTKIFEMNNDELCRFFKNLRNQIDKEGINGLNCSTTINSFNSSEDLIERPAIHLGKKIKKPDIVSLSKLYYSYLKKIIDEWTGLFNLKEK